MHILDSVTSRAGRLAGEVQASLRRAKVEGERRMLERQHRTALEELGAEAYRAIREGSLDEGPLGPKVAAVEARVIEIEAKSAELDRMRAADERPTSADPDGPAPPDPALAAFPMIADEPAKDDHTTTTSGDSAPEAPAAGSGADTSDGRS